MIKTKIKIKIKDKDVDYPKLMKSKHNSCVVLFTDYFSGTVVVSSKDEMIGEYSRNWDRNSFEDFNEKITLENKE